MFAPIYRALGRMGIGQAEADEMEIWVIAELIGPIEGDSMSAVPSAREINAARVAAAKAGASPPQSPGIQV